MVSVPDVKRWNTGQLDEIFQTAQQRLQALTHSGDDFGKVAPVADWSGPAADNANSAHRDLMVRVDKLASGASIVSKSIGQAADAITGVQHAIAGAEELARKHRYQITDNGTVTIRPSLSMKKCTPSCAHSSARSSPASSGARPTKFPDPAAETSSPP